MGDGRSWPRHLPRRARQVLRRVPLTLATGAAISALAAWSGALTGKTPDETIDRWGYDLTNLGRGRLHTLGTMHLLVFSRTHLATILVGLTIFLAPLEAKAGTRVAARIFWVSAIGGAFLSSVFVGLPGHLLGWRPTPNLVRDADIGGSIGVWGSAGALTVLTGRWLGQWAWLARGALALYLLAALRANPGIADVEHVVGFGIGTALAFGARLQHPAAAGYDG